MASKTGEPKKSPDFYRKIKTREEILALVGSYPRGKSVVMCQGVFDIVHPGHLRHLMYAKERGDVLIASLTCDAHIQKSNNQPFVPQNLRATNLAALEFVDYVLIDENPSPKETILFIKPDFFAKGFEYSATTVKSYDEEKVAIESYGGEILLTPGDATFLPPLPSDNIQLKLSIAKLLILMQAEWVTFADLRGALEKFKDLTLHVIGDTMVNSYTYCNATGGVTKTPTISVLAQSERFFAAGAAMVAKHLAQSGATVVVSTVLGDDAQRDFIVKDLTAVGVRCQPIIDATRPTTLKNTYVAQEHHLLCVNSFDNRIISDSIVQALVRSIQQERADGYIFSDYRNGIFAKNTIPTLVAALPKDAFKVADSQVASRWGNVLEFQGFDIITPNEREARFALGDQDSVVRPLALEIFKRAQCKLLLLKLGSRGIFAYREANPDPKSFFTVDSFAENVVDAAGAGDALLAYATLGMLATKSEVIASIIGACAAAVACEQPVGTAVSLEKLVEKINSIEHLATYSMADFSSTVELG